MPDMTTLPITRENLHDWCDEYDVSVEWQDPTHGANPRWYTKGARGCVSARNIGPYADSQMAHYTHEFPLYNWRVRVEPSWSLMPCPT